MPLRKDSTFFLSSPLALSAASTRSASAARPSVQTTRAASMAALRACAASEQFDAVSPDVEVPFVGWLGERTTPPLVSGEGVGVAAVFVAGEAAGVTVRLKSAPFIVPLIATPAVPATSTPATSAPL